MEPLIDHIEITVRDMDAAVAFYDRFLPLLGYDLSRRSEAFIERHDGGYRGKPPDDLIAQLEALGDDRGDVVDLLRYDYMVKEYATYFATAWFGEKIERIRWEILRERPNDWEHRFDDVQQHEPTIVRFGWRQADDRIRPEALAVFEDVIARYGGAT